MYAVAIMGAGFMSPGSTCRPGSGCAATRGRQATESTAIRTARCAAHGQRRKHFACAADFSLEKAVACVALFEKLARR